MNCVVYYGHQLEMNVFGNKERPVYRVQGGLCKDLFPNNCSSLSELLTDICVSSLQQRKARESWTENAK